MNTRTDIPIYPPCEGHPGGEEPCAAVFYLEEELSNIKAHLDMTRTSLTALKERLVESEGLLKAWLMNEINHVFQNSNLQEQTRAFLANAPGDYMAVRREDLETILLTKIPKDGFSNSPNMSTKFQLLQTLTGRRRRMPEPTIEELRKWSAEKVMGWEVHWLTENEYPSGHWYYDKELGYTTQQHEWQPDIPSTGQIWQVVEKVRELGWRLFLCYPSMIEPDKVSAGFVIIDKCTMPQSYCKDKNQNNAILKAAYAALEGRGRWLGMKLIQEQT